MMRRGAATSPAPGRPKPGEAPSGGGATYSAPRGQLSLKGRALAWLAQREHSRSELRTKLLRVVSQQAAQEAADGDAAPDPAEAVEPLLDWLEAHRYLSEARFVESRVNARAARYGNQRIRQELARHGVALDEGTQRSLRDSELARAKDVWLRKFGGQAAADAAQRAKQMRFLAARGFSAEVVRRVVRGGDEDA
jgi:regulatory protein